MKSLQGKFLIATNQMVDHRFKETVILICSHDDQGALGLVLTSPYPEIGFTDIFRSLNLNYADLSYPELYCGGPVAMEAFFVLLSMDIYGSTPVMDSVFLGNDMQFLTYLAKGNDQTDMRFFLGYSGWGPGQLEDELGFDGWLVLPASSEDVFSTPPQELWRMVTGKYGIDIDLFSDISGNA
jgi:putative transcriptional regulator